LSIIAAIVVAAAEAIEIKYNLRKRVPQP